MSNPINPKTFVKGAAVLGAASLLVQILGAAFRIPLANIIGDEGMGYFQTAYPIYIFILVFSTNGAPAAISKMVSEKVVRGNYTEAHRIFRTSFLLMAILGVGSALAVFLLAKPIVNAFGDPGAYYALIAIAPALLFVPLMSVFRGYFQGYQVMLPTAISQTVEQLVRVIVGLSLAFLLLPKGLQIAAAGASGAGSIGPIFGALFIALAYFYVKKRHKLPFDGGNKEDLEPEPNRSILLRMAKIAIPITIGVSVFPIMNVVDLLVVMRRLQDLGMTTAEANALYGQLSGYAGPIVNLPQSLALAMALSLVPAIAAAKSMKSREDMDNNIRLGLRISCIIAIPCALGVMVIPQQILDLIYPALAGTTQTAAHCLFLLGPGIFFICVAQAMAGVLQGLGKPGLSLISVVTGAAVKYVISYVLVGIEAFNVSGAAIGTTAGFCVVAVMNVWYVRRETHTKHDLKLTFLRPTVCSIVAIFVVWAVCVGGSHFMSQALATILALLIAMAVYGIMLIKTKAILPEEVHTFPKGDQIYKILEKLRLV